jgi:putative ABC transport system permease protein
MTNVVTWLDWKLGARMLVKYPGLSVIGGLTLAGTIGLGAAWFEVTRQIVNPRLPFDDGDRIVRIDLWDAAEAGIEPRTSYDFQFWSELESIDELGAFRSFDRNLITADGEAIPATVTEITPSAFSITRVAPLLGRTLIDADADPGAAPVVVIGYDIWQSRFNGDRDVVGRAVRIGRATATIAGVMPDGYRFPVRHQLWVPLRVASAEPRAGPGLRVFGRLSDDATFESAQAELNAVNQRTAAAHSTHARLTPSVSAYASSGPALGTSRLLRLSNIFAWLLLAGACANVATLMFARTATRESEILVRNALGASRARVMGQLFVEAFVLCGIAALVGLIAARLVIGFGVRMLHEYAIDMPFWWEFSIGPATILYAALLAFAGAALVGVLPAIRATGPRLQAALARMSSGGTSIRFGGVWSVMIVLQVMFAALCLPVGLNIAMSAFKEDPAPLTLPAHEYLTYRAELDREVATTDADALTVFAELDRQLEAEPSVIATTFSNGLPRMHYPLGRFVVQRDNALPVLIDAQMDGDRVRVASVDIGFFDTFRIQRVAGRAFHPADVGAPNNPVIINETLARSIGGNPLGARLRVEYATEGPWYEVVGLVRANGVMGDADFMFVPTSAADVSPAVNVIHVQGGAAAFAPRLRTLAAQVEPGLRLYEVKPLDVVHSTRDPIAVPAMTTIAAITLLAMALSAAGLYSLMAVAVTRRTREIGIRMSLGANPRAILTALFARAATQIGVGILVGVSLCKPLMAALGNTEPWSEVIPAMLVASAFMMLTGLVACGMPARRALRVQPTQAVRYGG